MAACLKVMQQSDGNFALALDPSAPDLTACAYVVESGAEVSNSLLSLSAQDGGYASAAIISCWVTAYAIRSIIQIIKGTTDE
jgi:hypothetical protein